MKFTADLDGYFDRGCGDAVDAARVLGAKGITLKSIETGHYLSFDLSIAEATELVKSIGGHLAMYQEAARVVVAEARENAAVAELFAKEQEAEDDAE